jgi:hypothetical protein
VKTSDLLIGFIDLIVVPRRRLVKQEVVDVRETTHANLDEDQIVTLSVARLGMTKLKATKELDFLQTLHFRLIWTIGRKNLCVVLVHQ